MSEHTPRDIQSKLALVTGASRGIGRALALELVREHGACVYACARSHDELLELQRDCQGLPLHIAALDICDTDALDELFARIEEEQGGTLDFLINNASVLGPTETLDMIEDEAWEHVLDVNVNGSFYVTKRALAMLRAASSADDADSPSIIINLSSSVGRKVRAEWGAYSISKYALEGLSALVAEEEDPSQVVSVTLNPGGTATQMRAEAYPDEDPDSIPSAEKVASTITLLLRTLDASCAGKRYSSRALFDFVDASSIEPGALPSE